MGGPTAMSDYRRIPGWQGTTIVINFSPESAKNNLDLVQMDRVKYATSPNYGLFDMYWLITAGWWFQPL
jgi:hypothetical protein